MSLKPEQITHINIVNWFHHTYPSLAEDFHHFANERRTSWKEGKTLKRMAVKRGVSDFHLAFAIGGFHGMWLELKENDGKLTPEQEKFIERKCSRGYYAVAVWGFDEAKKHFMGYIGSKDWL